MLCTLERMLNIIPFYELGELNKNELKVMAKYKNRIKHQWSITKLYLLRLKDNVFLKATNFNMHLILNVH